MMENCLLHIYIQSMLNSPSKFFTTVSSKLFLRNQSITSREKESFESFSLEVILL